jgi:bifunctional non-homologous end joining protein LigD
VSDLELRVGGRSVRVSRPFKVLFPDDGLTKADLARYYAQVAPTMLPHLRDRPLHMRRFPDGIAGGGIEQKQVPSHFPAWVERIRVPRKSGGEVTHVLCNDAATLVYLADQACIEPHVWPSRRDRLDHPDQVIFDLDPPKDGAESASDAARLLRELLDQLGLVPFVRSTGIRGLHVVSPLERRWNFDVVRAFARGVAELLAARHPDALTVAQRKEERRGRLFIDVFRNGYAQTVIAPYALRAVPGAPVAVPLEWREVGRSSPSDHTIFNVFERVERHGDPWQGLRRSARSLRESRRRLEALRVHEGLAGSLRYA